MLRHTNLCSFRLDILYERVPSRFTGTFLAEQHLHFLSVLFTGQYGKELFNSFLCAQHILFFDTHFDENGIDYIKCTSVMYKILIICSYFYWITVLDYKSYIDSLTLWNGESYRRRDVLSFS